VTFYKSLKRLYYHRWREIKVNSDLNTKMCVFFFFKVNSKFFIVFQENFVSVFESWGVWELAFHFISLHVVLVFTGFSFTGDELRALDLLDECCTISATPPVFLLLVCFSDRVSHFCPSRSQIFLPNSWGDYRHEPPQLACLCNFNFDHVIVLFF
jgi:hypothetical protein